MITLSREVQRVHRDIRQALIFCEGQPAALSVGSALAYELASVAAACSPDVATAKILIRALADGMCEQIKVYGVGRAHPNLFVLDTKRK